MLAGMTTSEASGRLDLLVLGGTSWVGGAVARRAAERGHRVTCLARGEAGEAPAGTEWVRADRSKANAYEAVSGRSWDAVVEVSWQPAFVRGALAALADRVGHWVYVSSASVYPDDATPSQAEDSVVHEALADGEPASWETYGPAKVACEQLVREAVGDDRALLARAGLIGGDGDRSDRLGYWPARIARAAPGEEVLAPPRDTPVQVVDVEDLVDWLLLGAGTGIAGAYNVVGDVTDIGAVLDASVAVAGVVPRLVEATSAWLVAQGVEMWAGPESLPLWLPQPEYAGFATLRNQAAREAGLQLRPLEATVDATLRWERERGLQRQRRAGLTPGREAELLHQLGGRTD
jgi:2'-hydroxyisoflavone reductase